MSLPVGWIAVAAVLALLLGLWLVLAGRGMRRRRGLGGGRTVSLDRVTLTSRRLGLPAGRTGLSNGRHDHRRGMEFRIVMHLFHGMGDEQKAPIALRHPRRHWPFRMPA